MEESIDLKLYKFCQDKEMRWDSREKLILWLNYDDVDSFVDTIGHSYFHSDNEIKCELQEFGIVLNLFDIFDDEIPLEKIFNDVSGWYDLFELA